MTLLAALLAVFLQAFAVQTHFHAVAPNVAGYSQGAAQSGEAHASVAHDQAACVLCQALASNGRAALPETTALAAPRLTHLEATALHIRAPPRFDAHAWQSRAPPTVL